MGWRSKRQVWSAFRSSFDRSVPGDSRSPFSFLQQPSDLVSPCLVPRTGSSVPHPDKPRFSCRLRPDSCSAPLCSFRTSQTFAEDQPFRVAVEVVEEERLQGLCPDIVLSCRIVPLAMT